MLGSSKFNLTWLDWSVLLMENIKYSLQKRKIYEEWYSKDGMRLSRIQSVFTLLDLKKKQRKKYMENAIF